MFIHVRDLQLRPARFDVELPPGTIEFLDPTLRQAGALHTVGQAELVTGSLDEIRIRGHVKVQMEADCDRCLEPAPFLVDQDMELYYRPTADGYGEEKSLDQSEAEMGFYDGEGLELNEVLREFVHLALPMQRLCREDCKGICPECGQNRNLKDCECVPAAVDDRWAALKKL